MSSNRNKIKLMIEPSRTISNNLSFSNLLPRKPKAFLIHINGIGFTIQNDQHAAFQFLKNRTIHTDTKFQNEDKIWTVPNMLCVCRIIASPFLCYFIVNSHYYSALGTLIFASLTDFADGFIARKYTSQSSKLGTFLDPLADKILIITLYSSLMRTHMIPTSLMILVVFRDILLLSAGAYIRYSSMSKPRTLRLFFDGSYAGATLYPTRLSKVNTVIQLVTAVISIYAPTTSVPVVENFLVLSWYTAGTTTILSGLSYLFTKGTYTIPERNSKPSQRSQGY